MKNSKYDLTNYAWLDHDSIGFPSGHMQTLEVFQKSVITPSLQAIDAEIVRFQEHKDDTADFFADHYAELFQTAVEGYLIAVQSIWERGLRAMLIRREEKLSNSPLLRSLERATWSGKTPTLQDHFLRLMGVPLLAFDTYADLDLLQCLASAIRHGDGASARKVHQLCPNLWFNWIAPGSEIEAGPFRIIAPDDGKDQPSFSSITVPQALLEQMIQSVMWFWEDIECMRCNSFKQKHHSVVTKISTWQTNRAQRNSLRVWHFVDGAFPKEKI